jgi:hypothetical protein
MGFVDQSGRFTAYGVGKVEVVVKLGSRMARTTIETVAGPPRKVLTSLDPDRSDSNRSILSITVDDKNWNVLGGVSLQVAVTGGKLDRTDIVTGDAGKVSVGITWDAPSVGQAEISCDDLPPVVVTRVGE